MAALGSLAQSRLAAFADDPLQFPKLDIAGLAIITASLGFYQATAHRKDALHIVVAGASLAASVITAVNNSPGANYAGLLVQGLKTGLGIYDLYKV